MDIDGKIGIGLLGFGVVGSEVARILVEKSERLAQQVGAPLVIQGILVRDNARPRSFE